MLRLLSQAKAGVPVKELCRRNGFSDASFYNWQGKYGGISVAEAKRFKELEVLTTKPRASRAIPNHTDSTGLHRYAG